MKMQIVFDKLILKIIIQDELSETTFIVQVRCSIFSNRHLRLVLRTSFYFGLSFSRQRVTSDL